jgi:hypothetical protein
MPCKSHPAAARSIAETLGVCRSAASRKVEAAEQLLEILVDRADRLAGDHRQHNRRQALIRRIAILARLVDRRPAEEFDAWLDTFLGRQAEQNSRKTK